MTRLAVVHIWIRENTRYSVNAELYSHNYSHGNHHFYFKETVLWNHNIHACSKYSPSRIAGHTVSESLSFLYLFASPWKQRIKECIQCMCNRHARHHYGNSCNHNVMILRGCTEYTELAHESACMEQFKMHTSRPHVRMHSQLQMYIYTHDIHTCAVHAFSEADIKMLIGV